MMVTLVLLAHAGLQLAVRLFGRHLLRRLLLLLLANEPHTSGGQNSIFLTVPVVSDGSLVVHDYQIGGGSASRDDAVQSAG